MPPWYHIENEADIATPALLFYRERIEHNLQLMLSIAGGAQRLRPHVKTHKTVQIIAWQVALGVTKFKCSTIAEAEMTADGGGTDIVLAMPAVGANAQRLVALIQRYPHVTFATIADHEETVSLLASVAQQSNADIAVYLELDCGMARTGVVPGARALAIAQMICDAPRLHFAGLHAYDGHIHDAELAVRQQRCDEAFAPVLAFRDELIHQGIAVPELIAGGSPTFGIHAQHADRTLSPGTTVLWDFGYGDKHPDLPFLPAALLLTRVVSKPGTDRITLDLGHKSVAPENPHPRVRFIELGNAAEALMQSEEHLVMQVADRDSFAIGQPLHGIPRHVCPTVSMHGEAVIIEGGKAVNRWPVTARNRRITV